MNLFYNPFSQKSSRIGFHYYPDALHYRETELQSWLPELTGMGAGWLLIKSSPNRAIPEPFIKGLIQNGIEPLIQFELSLNTIPNTAEINPIFEAYSRWGVKGAILFDRPNMHSAWPASTWAQNNLVEHFLDCYLPLAQSLDQLGIVSILPPLQPAGSYWDTAFLRAVLEGMERRKFNRLLEHMVLSCYAWSHQRSLNWGAGGPERWSSARPYFTPNGSQDHNGFRIYEWYQSISRSFLKKEAPVVLLQAGLPASPEGCLNTSISQNQEATQAAAQMLQREQPSLNDDGDIPLAPIPDSVLAGFFYCLASTNPAESTAHAWFQPDGSHHPIVDTFKALAAEAEKKTSASAPAQKDPLHPIQHYLLLPAFDWGVADWHLDIARPFIKKFRPTVGFSLDEAALAREVTVIGNDSAYSEEVLDQLRLSGSIVKRIEGIGIEIASQLTER